MGSTAAIILWTGNTHPVYLELENVDIRVVVIAMLLNVSGGVHHFKWAKHRHAKHNIH